VKTFIVILLATLCAAIGEAFLSYGMKRNGQIRLSEPSQWGHLILTVIRNPYVFCGVVFLALFFFLYLAALSWDDLSFVMPLTAMSYIFAALLAKFMLREEISWFRWAGTVIITLGILFIVLDGRQRSGESGMSAYQQKLAGGEAQPAGDEGNSLCAGR
jgi:drug/metabolite transporter (DMT)-like permease